MEHSQSQNLLLENFLKCRTCLAVGTENEISTTLCSIVNSSSTTTYKDVLVQIVPQMDPTVTESDTICFQCKKVLKTVARFILQCLEVEDQLQQSVEEGQSGELVMQVDDVFEEEEDDDDGELDVEGRVLENIEIIVQEEDSPVAQSMLHSEEEDSKLSPPPPQVDDHAYIKSEIEDGEICIDDQTGDFKLYIGDGSEDVEGDGDGEVFPDDPSEVSIKVEMDEDSMDETFFEDSNLEEMCMCEICGKGFRNTDMLKQHLTTHEDRSVQCPNCPKMFKSAMYLNRHINLVHEPDQLGVRYMCSECNKLFKNKGALNAHFKLKHLKLEPFKCEICDETFGRADYLKKHLSQHIKPEDKKQKMRSKVPGKFIRFKNTDDPVPCRICGKYYNGIHKLKVHLQTHVVVKRYACEYCDLTYKRWPSLKRHEKTHLEADGIFHRCNVCWKRLPTKEELEVHMVQHGNPRYCCHICQEQFHRKYLFDNHFLLTHATPEDLEISKKEVIYDTLLELANQSS